MSDMGRVAAIGHGRDEGQLYANCALRPAVPECPTKPSVAELTMLG